MNARTNYRKLNLQALERREAMAADAALSLNGDLIVTGTEFEDIIEVREISSLSQFSSNNLTGRTGVRTSGELQTIADRVEVIVKDAFSGAMLLQWQVEKAQVNRIVINALAGGDEVTNNTNLPSQIDGGFGDDHIYGGSGPDVILGGAGGGATAVNGGPSNQWNDRLFGRGGNDVLRGGDGHDWLEGGAGDDELFGDEGNDMLLGGADDDELFGGKGDDELHGHSGEDFLQGDHGCDELFGGDDIDTLVGDADFCGDVLAGGNARDLYFYELGDYIDDDELLGYGWSISGATWQSSGPQRGLWFKHEPALFIGVRSGI